MNSIPTIITIFISFITLSRFCNFFSSYISGISSIIGSLNLIVTIIIIKNFSLHYDQISLFPWSVFVTAILLIISLPVLAGTIIRRWWSYLIYQYLFWFFGHPEVYILISPGFGLISHIVINEKRNIRNWIFRFYL